MSKLFRCGLAALGWFALSVALVFSGSANAAEEAPRTLSDKVGLVVSSEGVGAPPMVLLHGICGEPVNGCSVFAGLGRGDLVCARADLACPSGGAMWSGGGGALRRIEDAVTRAASEGRFGLEAPRALIGFSQGAYVALRAARAKPGRYPSMLLIGAFVRPTRAELSAMGVRRLVLAAGDFDGAARTMRQTASDLEREGFDARFVSLGRVAHTYVADDREKLARAVEWTVDGVRHD